MTITTSGFENWVALIEEELSELDSEGMEKETCKVIALRGTDRLIAGENKAGDKMRGWLIDGESIQDIHWQWEEITGWPESVKI